MAESPTKIFNPNLEAKEKIVQTTNEEINFLGRRLTCLLSRIDEVDNKVQMLAKFYEDNVVDGSSEEVEPKGLPYFMQQFREILCKIMNHELAFPFLETTDTVALGQEEVIIKSMDLGTILTRMDLNEENFRHENINDICADVRLVFTNAMQCNDPGSTVHSMAQELSSEFEKMWFPLSLQVAHEEWRQHMRMEDGMEENAYEKLGNDLDEEQMLLSMQLEEIWEELTKNACRELSTEEKVMLKDNIGKLSVEDLYKAVQLGAKYDPDWDGPSDIADINLHSMAVIAQWMLYKFVEKCIKKQGAEQQAEVESASNGKNMQST